MVEQYLEHSKAILSSEYSHIKGGSKEMGLVSRFGWENEYDLRNGFPLLTTKKMAINSVIHELLWFLKGDPNIKYLVDNNIPVWNRDTFNLHLPEMIKEGIFPEGLVKYSPEWKTTEKEYIQRIKEDSEFAARWGSAGPIYGFQWRHWPKYVPVTVEIDGKTIPATFDVDGEEQPIYIKDKKGIDQIGDFILRAKKNPSSKKHIISAWNTADLPEMSLPPCHLLYQVNIDADDGTMDLKMFQRSCDMFLGVPFNIASYSMKTIILAQQLDLTPRRFIHSFGDVHFYFPPEGKTEEWIRANFSEFQERIRNVSEREEYSGILEWMKRGIEGDDSEMQKYNHVTAILEQLPREPRPLPTMTIAKKPFDKLTIDDFVLENYNPHPAIKRSMAV